MRRLLIAAFIVGTILSLHLATPGNASEIRQTGTATPTATPRTARTPQPTAMPRVPTSTPLPELTNAQVVATARAASNALRERELLPTAPPPIPLRERFVAKPGDIVREITPGLIHIYRYDYTGPLNINVLLFDLTRPEFDIKSGLGDGWLSGRSRTSYVAQQNDAIAAVNGDLFAEQGVPQGLTIIDAQAVRPPKHRATFTWSKDREPYIGYYTDSWTWQAYVVAENGRRAWIEDTNIICPYDEICLYNEFVRYLPINYYADEVKVVLGPSGRVFDILEGEDVFIDTGMRVLQGTGAGAAWLRRYVEISDTLELEIETTRPLDDLEQAISGGPIILKEGKFHQDCMCKLDDCSLVVFETAAERRASRNWLCEDFDLYWKETHYNWSYIPRTGLGYDKWKHTLIVAVVDGYQLGFSRGMLQVEYADLLREFGAYTAMELDGGGSATMFLEDQVVNVPSDQGGERYVANSLLFFWNEPTEPYDTARSCQLGQMCVR